IRAADQTHLWAEPQLGSSKDMFRFHSQVAERVANMLDVKLLQREQTALAAPPTTNQDAYGYYVLGRGALASATRSAHFDSAATLFRRATELDSRFALAFAGLSRASAELYRIERRPPELVDTAISSAQTALQLDSELPEAHMALGRSYYITGDYEKAVREYEQARRVRPQDADLLS